MQVPISEVEKIATLSRISLSEQEKKMYQHNLLDILEAAQKLSELDTSDVTPTAHIQGLENVTREDIVQASMDNELLTANAPQSEHGCFIVPKVVE
ncbi:MAG: Asp-tRNA(Asn)/Glu-tRNA(Gln) amidotransferase subunit GatC [Clostridia bacterium]|jgi:aspartyl-tRNA(Asn)/glutamyl-tRNA(Gln) amidotransferase subunit C|nr:Asp-tRNA(Asn)/Glu-tRNA(Gln) amidotransferase subunit GatC [Clostridia bacterium]MBT7122093.1 Asp-tRNA(Asn)/Glu-tRNA(Gln) amidotransferase subunit GatC [Clostridia bacterium]